MGILRKLFGSKKKQSEKEQPKQASKPTDESRDVSLEEVNKELKDLEVIEEDKDIEKEEVQTKTEKAQVKTPPQKESAPQKEEASGKTYHIKKHPKGWQVIEEDAEKAYRVFDYQKQAIDFAKEENLDYKVFKSDGTPRD